MNNDVRTILAFVLGAAVGSAVTWKIVKTKYEAIAQEEIDSVKEVYARKKEELISLYESGENDAPTPEEKDEYKDIAADYGVIESENETDNAVYDDEDEEGGFESMDGGPYVITPDEFGKKDGYETVTLTFYADDILTDDSDEPIFDVDDVVGEDSLTHFGEFEDDVVYVRNDERKCDYEICMDNANYYDA